MISKLFAPLKEMARVCSGEDLPVFAKILFLAKPLKPGRADGL